MGSIKLKDVFKFLRLDNRVKIHGKLCVYNYHPSEMYIYGKYHPDKQL